MKTFVFLVNNGFTIDDRCPEISSFFRETFLSDLRFWFCSKIPLSKLKLLSWILDTLSLIYNYKTFGGFVVLYFLHFENSFKITSAQKF